MKSVKKSEQKSTYALGKQGKSDFAITKNGKKTDLSTIDIKHAKNVIKTLNKNQPDLSKKMPKEGSKKEQK
jgi:hypothetical protein